MSGSVGGVRTEAPTSVAVNVEAAAAAKTDPCRILQSFPRK